jgi:hypothetical protein
MQNKGVPAIEANPTADLAALDKAFDVVDHLITTALQSNGYDRLRSSLSDKAMNLSIRLSCIADAEYLEHWEARKETGL